jgi:hypothetical protein
MTDFYASSAQRPVGLIALPVGANPPVALPALSEAERARIERQIETVQEAARNARDQVQRFLILGQLWLLQARLDGFDREGASRSWWLSWVSGAGVVGDHGCLALGGKIFVRFLGLACCICRRVGHAGLAGNT